MSVEVLVKEENIEGREGKRLKVMIHLHRFIWFKDVGQIVFHIFLMFEDNSSERCCLIRFKITVHLM